jgi:hypothetical protein
MTEIRTAFSALITNQQLRVMQQLSSAEQLPVSRDAESYRVLMEVLTDVYIDMDMSDDEAGEADEGPTSLTCTSTSLSTDSADCKTDAAADDCSAENKQPAASMCSTHKVKVMDGMQALLQPTPQKSSYSPYSPMLDEDDDEGVIKYANGEGRVRVNHKFEEMLFGNTMEAKEQADNESKEEGAEGAEQKPPAMFSRTIETLQKFVGGQEDAEQVMHVCPLNHALPATRLLHDCYTTAYL